GRDRPAGRDTHPLHMPSQTGNTATVDQGGFCPPIQGAQHLSSCARCSLLMLSSYPRDFGSPPAGAVWIDLFDPTDEEKSSLERTFGLRVPTREELSEIETTSRLRTERNALYMTAPLMSVAEDGTWSPAPTGFVLS